MRNEIFMNFHFPARTATCAAAHDGSALSVTLCLFATRSLFPAPPEMPPGFAWPVFRPARLTVPRLTTAPRFCVVTLRALRDGQLLVPPQKTPCACGATAFSSAGCAVRLLRTPPRFLSRCAPSAAGNCSLLRRTCRWPAASLFFGLRSSLLPCSRALRASTYTYPKSGRPGRG